MILKPGKTPHEQNRIARQPKKQTLGIPQITPQNHSRNPSGLLYFWHTCLSLSGFLLYWHPPPCQEPLHRPSISHEAAIRVKIFRQGGSGDETVSQTLCAAAWPHCRPQSMFSGQNPLSVPCTQPSCRLPAVVAPALHDATQF